MLRGNNQASVTARARTAAIGLALILLAAIGGHPAPAIAAATVVDIPVSFQVVNRNTSWVPCYADGKTYTIHGHLVGQATTLATRHAAAATLYLHGLGFASWFWQFTPVAGYNYTSELAQLGQVSVVIDRLGHGLSTLANGRDTCIGAQADMAHQIVQQLKAGSYTRPDGHAPVAFAKLALAGHSAGGEIAEVEAYSFGDIDALLVMSWADQVPSLLATATLGGSSLACTHSATGYADFSKTDADFQKAMFASATPQVVAAATPLRVADPCGDLSSVILGLTVDQVGAELIRVPVLQVCGAEDALFTAADCKSQILRYFGASDRTLLIEPATAHAFTLETSAPQTRQAVVDWLGARGF